MQSNFFCSCRIGAHEPQQSAFRKPLKSWRIVILSDAGGSRATNRESKDLCISKYEKNAQG